MMVVGVGTVVEAATTTTTTSSNPVSTFMKYKYGGGSGGDITTTTTSSKTMIPSSSSITTTTTATTTSFVEPSYCTIISPPTGTIWVYTGILMDPYTGQRICNVEGIEYIQPISQCNGRLMTNNNNNNHYPPSTIITSKDTSSSSLLSSNLPDWFQQYYRRCRSLQITSILQDYYMSSGATTINNNMDDTVLPQQEQQIFVQSDTMISRKLFCYTTTNPNTTTTTTNDDDPIIPNLFTRYRKKASTNPLAPTTIIPLDQVMTCYDSIISSIGITRTSSRNNNNNNSNDDDDDAVTDPDRTSSSSSSSSCWILHTEIPTTTNINNTPLRKRSHRASNSIWSCIDTPSTLSSSNHPSFQRSIQSDDHNNMLDFSIFTRRRSIPLSLSSVISDNLNSNNNNRNLTNESAGNRRRQRRQWIQFGGNNRDTSRKNELGVRETYQYYNTTTTATTSTSNKNNKQLSPREMKVRYTRYGEAPVWYGPGRVCVLELIGTRLHIPSPPPTLSIASSSPEEIDLVNTRLLQQYVPVIPSIISKYIPNFWNVLPVPTSFKHNIPTSYKSTMRCDSRDDQNFVYYANALHPVLQLHDNDYINQNEPFDMGNSTTTATANKYRQYYHDLAIGRHLKQLLHPATNTLSSLSPPQQLLQNIEAERRRYVSTNVQRSQQMVQNIQHAVFSTWDKLRSESTLSLW